MYSNRTHSASPGIVEALTSLQEQGNKVILASSRTMRELDHLPRDLYHYPFDARILDGGSRILDKKGNDVFVRAIPESTVEKIQRFCQEKNLIWRYSTAQGNYWGSMPDIQAHTIYFDLYLSTPVYKPYDKDEVLNILIFIKDKKELLSLIPECGVVLFDEGIEIRAQGIDKIHAIRWCKENYELEKIICFGDGENDIEMLKGADLGICMGNGNPRLKEVADRVIGTVTEGGIAQYLKEEKLI